MRTEKPAITKDACKQYYYPNWGQGARKKLSAWKPVTMVVTKNCRTAKVGDNLPTAGCPVLSDHRTSKGSGNFPTPGCPVITNPTKTSNAISPIYSRTCPTFTLQEVLKLNLQPPGVLSSNARDARQGKYKETRRLS